MKDSSLQVSEVILAHKNVKLVPMEVTHRDGLLQAAEDGRLWQLWYTSVPDENGIDDYIKQALDERRNRKSLPFTVLDNDSNKVIGSTRYMNIEPHHHRLEIGSTWYAKSRQKTEVNTICKWLLLRHAFEQLGVIAVEFRTHFFNHRSRAAIARLGAKQDGILRNHRIDQNGLLRDTVVFSILNSEWSAVKKSLLHKLETKEVR